MLKLIDRILGRPAVHHFDRVAIPALFALADAGGSLREGHPALAGLTDSISSAMRQKFVREGGSGFDVSDFTLTETGWTEARNKRALGMTR